MQLERYRIFPPEQYQPQHYQVSLNIKPIQAILIINKSDEFCLILSTKFRHLENLNTASETAMTINCTYETRQ